MMTDEATILGVIMSLFIGHENGQLEIPGWPFF